MRHTDGRPDTPEIPLLPLPEPLENRRMRAPLTLLTPVVALLGLAGTSLDAHAGAQPARKALGELTDGETNYNVVQNRFFLKQDRFELSPMAGYVPNNPFAKRYIGGVLAAWHFSETLAAEGAFLYSPDLGVNDLKDLTHTLVGIAREGSGDVEFQQPVDKMLLGATVAARWAPVYGKINLLGERVLNFDLYGTAGLGLLTVNKYYAVYDDDVLRASSRPAGRRGQPVAAQPRHRHGLLPEQQRGAQDRRPQLPLHRLEAGLRPRPGQPGHREPALQQPSSPASASSSRR